MLVGYGFKATVAEVTKGNVDLTPGDVTFEKQSVQAAALSAITGTFALSLEGSSSPAIPYTATAAQTKTALQALPTMHTADVQEVATSGWAW